MGIKAQASQQNQSAPNTMETEVTNNHLAMKTNHKQNDSLSELNDTDNNEKDTAVTVEQETSFLNGTQGNDADMSDEEEEEEQEITKKANCMGRPVILLQHGLRNSCEWLNVKCKGHFFHVILLLLYCAYFIYAMYYRFGDESSIRLLWCTLLGVVIATRHKVYQVVGNTRCAKWWLGDRSPTAAARIRTVRFFIRWFLYGGVAAFVAYIIADTAITNPARLRSLPGIVAFPLICFLISSHPSHVNWHTIYWSMALQLILAVLIMKWQGGKDVVLWVQARLDSFFGNTKPASVLLFGESYKDHYLVFEAFPTMFLTNAVLSMLYHVGAMQFLIMVIGTVLQFVLDTTPVESTGVAASIFMEGVTSFLAVRPYLRKLTHSELFALTSSCMASIGGAYLAVLSQLQVSVEYVLSAMIISAPATFTICKLIAPETRKPKKLIIDGSLPPEMQYKSVLEAAQSGAMSVVSVLVTVTVSCFSFFALISFANSILIWFGDRVGIFELTLEKILSYVFYPVALLMGVDLWECRQVGMLMGLRFTSASLVAVIKMQQLVANRAQLDEYSLIPNASISYVGDHIVLEQWNVTLIDGVISRRAEAISTFALCGFCSILSLCINMGVLATLLPERREWVTSMAAPLLLAGNVANSLVGCFAGLLV